mgnify:CR=1 FL=1
MPGGVGTPPAPKDARFQPEQLALDSGQPVRAGVDRKRVPFRPRQLPVTPQATPSRCSLRRPRGGAIGVGAGALLPDFIEDPADADAAAEAAAAGAFGALILSWFYKTLKWQNFKESVFLTAKTTAMIMWLFIGSWTFSSVFSYLGGHEVFEHFFTSINITTWQFLIITQIIIFLLGWPLEWTEILIIFVPIFLPLLEIFNVNPYFFAMLIALNLQTSFLTPPMAMSAYYLKGVQKTNVELLEIFKGIMPFLGIVIFGMFLMYMFPGIALWLPEVLFAD